MLSTPRHFEIRKGPPILLSGPTITGTVEVGQTLTVRARWFGAESYSYQWFVTPSEEPGSGAEIPGATEGTLLVTGAYPGERLWVRVTAANRKGEASADSAVTIVVPGESWFPHNTALPTITGTAKSGSTLTAHHGTWTNSPTGYEYHWFRSGHEANIGSGETHKLVAGDVGHTITVEVQAANAQGSDNRLVAFSEPTAVIAA